MSLSGEIGSAVIDALYDECEECAKTIRAHGFIMLHCKKCDDQRKIPSRIGVELLDFVRRYINRDDI